MNKPLLVLLLLVPIHWACSDLEMGETFEPEPNYPWDQWSDTHQGADTTLPEPEVELILKAPQAGKDYVFIASTNLDAIAKIDARSLHIESIAVGRKPIVVRTQPHLNTAVVLNLGSADIHIVHAEAAGNVVRRVKTEPGMNRLDINPTGDYVIASFDPDAMESGDPMGNLQTIHLVRTTKGQETGLSLAVSLHVRDVLFTPSAPDLAYVVTDDYLHVIDMPAVLANPTAYDPGARVPLVDDHIASPDNREVHLTADGHYCLISSAATSAIVMIENATGDKALLPLDAPPTDLDLLPRGQGGVVVVRDTAQVVLFHLPEAFSDPSTAHTIAVPDGIPFGQALLTPDGRRAIVFTTALATATLGEVDIAAGTLKPYRLGSGKVVKGAALSPGGRYVYVLHAADATTGRPIDLLDGFSLVDLDSPTLFDKFFQTDAAPSAVAFMPDDAHMVALVNHAARDLRQALRLDLSTMVLKTENLGSPPLQVGTLPGAGRVYVAQRHPVGRISFIEVATGVIQTVTGFELNTLIR